jgi:hypothetical protein
MEMARVAVVCDEVLECVVDAEWWTVLTVVAKVVGMTADVGADEKVSVAKEPGAEVSSEKTGIFVDDDVGEGGISEPTPSVTGSADGMVYFTADWGFRFLPLSGGPLKLPALQADWMAVHLASQMAQFLEPVGGELE